MTVSAHEDRSWVVVEIADTGIGIAAEALPHIFEEFNQGGAEARRKGGTGLGLAIVKHLVELHGGSISVTSVLGEGTAFSLRLPAAPTASQPTSKAREPGSAALEPVVECASGCVCDEDGVDGTRLSRQSPAGKATGDV